jgi:DNA-directed RNA polymerase subunit alpha
MQQNAIIKPHTINISKISNFEYSLLIEPLEITFGHTLGYLLKTLLTESHQGYKITEISFVSNDKIVDLQKEYDTINLLPSLDNFLSYLNGIYFLPKQQNTKINHIIDILPQSNFSCSSLEFLNPACSIGEVFQNLTENHYKIEFTVATHPRYLTREKSIVHNSYLFDTNFSVIKSCDYKVQDTRVKNITDYNRLTMQIATHCSVDMHAIIKTVLEKVKNEISPHLTTESI